MTTELLLKNIINYDERLEDKMLYAIDFARTRLSALISQDEYIDYINNGLDCEISSISIEEIDNINYIKIIVTKDNGLLYFKDFQGDYDFLNNKIGVIENEINDDNNLIYFVLIKASDNFSTEYDEESHSGHAESEWAKDMQKAEVMYAVYFLLPSAKRLDADLGIFRAASYGESDMNPETITDFNAFRKGFINDGDSIIRKHSIRKLNASRSSADSLNEYVTLGA